MAIVYLSLGSNIGDRQAYLNKALQAVDNRIGKINLRSKIYETESWGYNGRNFLNMAVEVFTSLSPEVVLDNIRKIETELKRNRLAGEYSDRTIDIDILFYDEDIFESENLKIPHPQIQNRLFVLIPLMDIAAELEHPFLHKTIKVLAKECTDKGWIRESK